MVSRAVRYRVIAIQKLGVFVPSGSIAMQIMVVQSSISGRCMLLYCEVVHWFPRWKLSVC